MATPDHSQTAGRLEKPILTKNVPILRIPFSQKDVRFIQEGIDDILDSGFLSMGKYTREFEALFAEFAQARHAVSCSNGTTAIELILRALEIEGGSVIVPTNTFLATACAVMHSGNRVIFADSDPSTLSLDVADVRRRLTDDIKAVILVHIGGIISPAVFELQELCRDRGIHLIEDCAHAQGCSINGHHAGTLGVAGAFSFFSTKVLTTGEGGMVTTSSDELAERMRMIRNHGKNPEMGNRMSELGHNYKLNEFTAMLGVGQLRKAPALMEERRRVAAFYDETVPAISGVRPVRVPDNAGSTYYKYIAYLDEGYDRGEVKRILKEKYGVSLTGEVYAELCHTEPLWERYTYCGRRRRDGRASCHRWPSCGCDRMQSGFPQAEYISRHHVCLPSYPGLTEAEMEHVVTSLESALREARES